jgi:hypothetical protein
VTISQTRFQKALHFLVSIEPNPAQFASMADYRTLKAPYDRAIVKAHALIHAYGAHLASYGLACMQMEYRLTLHLFESDVQARAVVARTLNDQWHRLAGWQAPDIQEHPDMTSD